MRMLRTPSSRSESFILQNQLSIYGAASDLCEQFGLTEGEEGQEKQKESRDERCIDKCEITRSKNFWYLLQDWYLETDAGKHSGLRITLRDNSIDKGVRRRVVPAQCISWYELQSSTWRGRWFWADHSILPRDDSFGQIIPLCREYTLSQVNSQSRASAAIPAGTIIGPVIEFRSWKFLTNVDLKL